MRQAFITESRKDRDKTRIAAQGWGVRRLKKERNKMKSIMENTGVAVAENIATQSSASEGPVIIVDDDSSDGLLAEGVIDELDPRFPVQILSSGEDLIAYLQGEELYRDRSRYPYPGLVLLDLKMPKMDGFAVLQWLKGHPEHAQVPIVVLSGCVDMAWQVTRAYQLGAHSFLPKPVQQQDIQSILLLLKVSI
jgi:CheY-like chemotaxis protein